MKKKILVLGLMAAYLTMAAACSNNTKTPDSMADKGSQNSSVAQGKPGVADPADNVSIADDIGNTINNVIDDTADGISDLFGGNNMETDNANNMNGSNTLNGANTLDNANNLNGTNLTDANMGVNGTTTGIGTGMQ